MIATTQNIEKLNFIHKIDISKNYLNICTGIRTKEELNLMQLSDICLTTETIYCRLNFAYCLI